jgi:hypothetical protein
MGFAGAGNQAKWQEPLLAFVRGGWCFDEPARTDPCPQFSP